MARLSLVLLVIGAALLPSDMAWTSVQKNRVNLSKIRSEIERKKKQKEGADQRARALAKEAARATKELAAARKALGETETRLAMAERAKSDAEARLLTSYRDLRDWRDRLEGGVRDYYVRLAVPAEGASSSLTYETALLSDRAANLAFAQQNHRSVQGLRDDMARSETALLKIRVQKQDEETRAELARKRLREFQKTEEGRRLVLERQIQELNVSAKSLEKKIALLIRQDRIEKERQRRAQEAPPAEPAMTLKRVWRGSLIRPVQGPVVSRFGRGMDDELGVAVIRNGATFRPTSSDPVRAAAAGEVLFAEPFMNYGRMVLVSHPDRLHTLYAHLGDVRVVRGQKVAAGDPVGVPGRDEEGNPSVYFEVRIDGEPVNPEPWLK